MSTARTEGMTPMVDAEWAIRLDAVSFSYGKDPLLVDVSIDVTPGTVVGLLGPNGTGKSTLLGLIAGDRVPTSGTIRVAGQDITSMTLMQLARVRAVMPQSSEFPFAYTVRDIVAMGRNCWDTGAAQDARIVEEAMAATDVGQLADREVTHLSGGERARVTLARVLAQESQIVLLDEPTAAFDIAHQERTMQLCQDLAREGKTVVAVMHDIQLAAAYCDEIALMNDGRIVACGAPESVLTDERLTDVYRWPISTAALATGEFVIIPQRSAGASSDPRQQKHGKVAR